MHESDLHAKIRSRVRGGFCIGLSCFFIANRSYVKVTRILQAGRRQRVQQRNLGIVQSRLPGASTILESGVAAARDVCATLPTSATSALPMVADFRQDSENKM